MLNQFFFTPHAIREADAENISLDDLIDSIIDGEMIEDYPDDDRGHSCLVFGYSKNGRPLHSKCAIESNKTIICTAYEPNLSKMTWKPDLRTRIRKERR